MLNITDNAETKGRARTRFFHILYSLLLIGVIALAAPVSAAMHTLNPGDPIEQNITDANAGDTLILNPGTYNQHNIHVTKNIVIRANTSYGGTAANTIINGQMQDGIFNVTGIHSLAIDNLSFQNGSTRWGGAINLVNGGTLTVNSSVFKNCSATGTGNGGAIIIGQGSGYSVATSTFSNCSAPAGGAIRIDPDSSGTITGTSFSNCSAAGDGGAILFVGPLSSTITGSTFSNCSATGRGGAIKFESGTLTVTSSTFSRCSAAGGGGGAGAIFAGDSSTLTVNSSTFSRCSATGSAGDAGAIFLQSATAGITSSTFYNCTSPGSAAIFSFQSDTTVNFSRIYGMPSMAVSNNSGTMNARDNWWGSNTNPSAHVQYATYSPWLILNITATPALISGSQTSTIRVNLTRNTIVHDTTSGGIFVPDGIPVAYARSSGTGSILPQAGNITYGANTTTFTPAGAGTSTISATVDGETVTADIIVAGSPNTATMVGVYRPSIKKFILKNGTERTVVAWGLGTDTPVAGDWNGDGLGDLGVFRPSIAKFILKNGTERTVVPWGLGTDTPVAGDWNGDGLGDLGVFRPSIAKFILKNGTERTVVQWGLGTDIPVTGDWNGDSLADVGVYRPSIQKFILKNGTERTVVPWGLGTDTPVTGDWNGDGLGDVGVYRPSIAKFILKNGTERTVIPWGLETDIPVTGKWS